MGRDFGSQVKLNLSLYSDNFKGFFENAISKNNTFGSLFYTYNVFLDKLIDDFTENLYFLSNGCTFETYELTTETGEPITENSDRDDVFKAIKKYFEDKKQKLDMTLFEYAQKIDEQADVSIKEFPKDADKREKDFFDKMAKQLLINRELSPNGKYDMMTRRSGKSIVRFLLENGLNENWGIVFMNKYINHNIERSTIVNYFNECPKDMPIKK